MSILGVCRMCFFPPDPDPDSEALHPADQAPDSDILKGRRYSIYRIYKFIKCIIRYRK